MSGELSFLTVMKAQQRRQRWLLLGAAAAGAATAASSVLLLGLSGWFIAGAGAAGAGGVASVMAFNYLLPSAAVRLFASVRTAGRYAERLLGHTAAFKAMASFRSHVFRALAQGRPEVSLGFSTGEASSRLVQDVDAIENQFVGLSAPPTAIVAVVAGLFILSLLGVWPALVLCFGVLIQTLGGRLLHHHLTEASSARVQASVGALKDAYNSFADAAPELICYNFTNQAVDLIMAKDQALAHAKLGAARGEGAVAALQAICMALTAGGVLLAAGDAPAALAAMAALASAAAVDSAAGLLRSYERQGGYRAAVERLSEIETRPASCPDAAPGVTPAIGLKIGGRILTIGAMDRVAIGGASGSGKTRLLEELLKLRPDAHAEITIGDLPIGQLDAHRVRALFSYLPQNAPALSGTIKENLLLANPAATDDALWAALGAAELADRVTVMPDGLMTWVGHAGERLSGGEKRRLCLARALLRPAQWLVLDEPTEGLDPVTEQRVVANIEAHLNRQGQGLILVSHRPHPLRLCPLRFDLTE